MSMFASIRRWFVAGKWTAAQVRAAANKGWITEAEADDITGVTEP